MGKPGLAFSTSSRTLRPDFLLTAMLEGACFIVEPFTDGKRLKWVMDLVRSGLKMRKEQKKRKARPRWK